MDAARSERTPMAPKPELDEDIPEMPDDYGMEERPDGWRDINDLDDDEMDAL